MYPMTRRTRVVAWIVVGAYALGSGAIAAGIVLISRRR
jgi:hypothetical protein